MENASKALLIAGAILIVIILISVGMLIVNSTRDITDQAGDMASTQATQAFNAQFTKYNGSQKGTAVKSLYETVRASNAVAAQSGGHIIRWNGATTDATLDAKVSGTDGYKNSTRYTVVCVYDADGYVENITTDPVVTSSTSSDGT